MAAAKATPTSLPATAPSAEMVGLMGTFALRPDDAHLRDILLRAKDSDDPRLMAVWDYEQVSKATMTPVDPGTDVSASAKRLERRAPADFRLLEEIMILHENPWRQWTAAKVLGYYAGRESIPRLRVLLGSRRDFVQRYAREAIEQIEAR